MLSSSSILKINFQIRLHFRLFYVRNFSNSQNLTLAKPLLFIMFEVWLYSRLLLMYYVSVFYDDGMIITTRLLSFPYVMVKVSLKAIWKSPSSFICASESAVVYKRDEERRLCCFSRLYSKCILNEAWKGDVFAVVSLRLVWKRKVNTMEATFNNDHMECIRLVHVQILPH